MENSSDCPGRFKCHGCSGWCDVCGDVDLICDDPKCDAHDRGSEREKAWREASLRLSDAEYAYLAAKKEELAARRHWERWKTGHPVMVARCR